MYQWPPGEPKDGQRVWLGLKSLLNSTGTVRFVGKIADQQGDFAGVELDDPKGKNDGEAKGVRYFTCPPNHGLFVKLGAIAPKSFEVSNETWAQARRSRPATQDDFRRLFLNAIEDHDVSVLQEMLPMAINSGVDAANINAAKRLIQYLEKSEQPANPEEEEANGDTGLQIVILQQVKEMVDTMKRLEQRMESQEAKMSLMQEQLLQLTRQKGNTQGEGEGYRETSSQAEQTGTRGAGEGCREASPQE
eukprot:TRINITY_DN38149_c0_g1_i1.p1 TRINITY_DN38149_c0_g1~~TRINITY_DN38149_c0_g1_i1.p1  ORF type:complete len:248 (-),score=48.46 TRINITY_DN38149_c0_g1_i1:48-791(-)